MFDLRAWTEEFISKANTPMDKDTSYLFMQMLMSENNENFTVEPVKNEFMYQMIEKRAEYIGLELSNPAKVFLMFLTRSPGTAVMYLYAIRSKVNKANMQDLTNIFPMGYLSEAELETMWDKQKGYNCDVKADNCLDAFKFM